MRPWDPSPRPPAAACVLVLSRVFVLVDPAVFSAPLEAAARSFLESDPLRDAAAVQRVLVPRVLRAALGPECDGRGVTRALQVRGLAVKQGNRSHRQRAVPGWTVTVLRVCQALGDRAVEQRFQEVVAAVEQSLQLGADGYAAYVSALEQIHTELLATRNQGGEASSAPTGGDGSLLPRPRIIFCLWKDEKNLSQSWIKISFSFTAESFLPPHPFSEGKLLEKFALISSSSVDQEENDKIDSVVSGDSSIERDLKETEQRPVRKPAWSWTWEPGDVRKHLTARVVVMGDDRVLGRLARAYHGLRSVRSVLPSGGASAVHSAFPTLQEKGDQASDADQEARHGVLLRPSHGGGALAPLSRESPRPTATGTSSDSSLTSLSNMLLAGQPPSGQTGSDLVPGATGPVVQAQRQQPGSQHLLPPSDGTSRRQRRRRGPRPNESDACICCRKPVAGTRRGRSCTCWTR